MITQSTACKGFLSSSTNTMFIFSVYSKLTLLGAACSTTLQILRLNVPSWLKLFTAVKKYVKTFLNVSAQIEEGLEGVGLPSRWEISVRTTKAPCASLRL